MDNKVEKMLHDEKKDVYCDGSSDAKNGDSGYCGGHPKVFLTYENGRVRCPYCGKNFEQFSLKDET